jgi:hypothetical protein
MADVDRTEQQLANERDAWAEERAARLRLPSRDDVLRVSGLHHIQAAVERHPLLARFLPYRDSRPLAAAAVLFGLLVPLRAGQAAGENGNLATFALLAVAIYLTVAFNAGRFHWIALLVGAVLLPLLPHAAAGGSYDRAQMFILFIIGYNLVLGLGLNVVVGYAGLLDLGHQKGIAQIEVVPLQLPTTDNGNFAICKATVVSKMGESFTDIGDANPNNCSSKVSRHLLRLASTRAIARALRTFTNIGMTCLEEIDFADPSPKGNDHEKTKNTEGKNASPKTKAAGKNVPKEPGAAQPPQHANHHQESAGQSPAKAPSKGDQPKMSEAQKRAIYNLSRRRGISVEQLEKMAQETYGQELENLTGTDASSFIRNLQQAA